MLIVCPAALRLNWQAEWRRWHTGPLRATLLDVWPGGLFDGTAGKALIVSYDSVRKWHPQIAATAWDLLILDEAHIVKDSGTRRAKSLFGGKYKGIEFQPIQAKHRLFLTGTAIVNRAEDLWPLVHALAPEGLGASRADFLERYSGSARLDELHLRLRTQIMVRRKKDDVLKDLPAKRRQIVLLDVDDSGAVLAAEAKAVDLMRALSERTRQEIAGLPHQEQVMRLRQCRAIALAEIAKVRKETAMAKLPAALEHISDVLGNVDKVIVFGWHHDVLDAIAREFGCAKIHRQDRAEVRQTDGLETRAEQRQADDLAVPLRLRPGDGGSGVFPGNGHQGVYGLPEGQHNPRAVPDTYLSDVPTSQTASQAGRGAVRSGLAGDRDTGQMPGSGYSAGDHWPAGSPEQSLAGSVGADQGVHKGERLGHQLAGESHQGRREPAGADGGGGRRVERTRPPLAVQLDGRTSEADRQSAVERFQNDPSCRVFVGSIRAAGLGLTLTAASTVVFVELDWTPAMMMQAEDRAHRIGQHYPVLVQHLVIDGSLDAKMSRILIDKQAIIDAALDGGGAADHSRDILTEVMRA